MRRMIQLTVMLFFLLAGLVCKAQVIDTVCLGSKGNIYRVRPTPGSSYYWKVDGGSIIAGQGFDSVIVNWDSVAGTRMLNVTEVNNRGCTGDTVKALVLVRGKPDVSIDGPTDICLGEKTLLTAKGAGKYLWSTGERTPSIIVSPDSSQDYSVIGFGDGCGDDTAFWALNVHPKPEANFSFTPNEPQLDQNIDFMYSGNSNVSDWEWIFNDSQVVKSNDPNPSFTFRNPGLRKVTLVVRNVSGCTDTISYTFYFKREAYIFVPNAFSPDGNGVNDIFKPVGFGIRSVQFAIFNRWGERVFEGDSMDSGWDGQYKGAPADKGTYIYTLRAQGIDGKWHYLHGTIVLLR